MVYQYFGKDEIRCDGSGRVLTPGTSAFSAYSNTAQTNVTGQGQVVTVVCGVENQDIRSEYAIATGLFTTTLAGWYHFTCSVALENLDASATLGELYLFTTDQTYTLMSASFGAMRHVGNNIQLSGSKIVYLAASKAVGVKVMVDNMAVVVVDIAVGIDDTNFEGFLLG